VVVTPKEAGPVLGGVEARATVHRVVVANKGLENELPQL